VTNLREISVGELIVSQRIFLAGWVELRRIKTNQTELNVNLPMGTLTETVMVIHQYQERAEKVVREKILNQMSSR
jgi:hypothetical protein